MCGAVVRWMPPLVSGARRSPSLRTPAQERPLAPPVESLLAPASGALDVRSPMHLPPPASRSAPGASRPLDAQPHVLSCLARRRAARNAPSHTLTGCEPPTRTQSRGLAGSAPSGLVSSATLVQLPVRLGSFHDPPGKNVLPPMEGRDEDGAEGRGGEDCLLGSSVVGSTRARVAKLADAADLKSAGPKGPSGFDPRLVHSQLHARGSVLEAWRGRVAPPGELADKLPASTRFFRGVFAPGGLLPESVLASAEEVGYLPARRWRLRD